jgi:hypothetical protein
MYGHNPRGMKRENFGGHNSLCRSAAALWSRGSATVKAASSISCQSLGRAGRAKNQYAMFRKRPVFDAW